MQVYRLVIKGTTYTFGLNTIKALEELIGSTSYFANLKHSRQLEIFESDFPQFRRMLEAVDPSSLSPTKWSDWIAGDRMHWTAYSLLTMLRSSIGLDAHPAA